MKLFASFCISFLILFSLNVNAKKPPKKFLKDDYIFKGGQNIKWPYKTGLWGQMVTHERIHQNPWALRYNNSLTEDYTLRFEIRQGDCGEGDCDRTSKKFIGRTEVGFFDPPGSDTIKGHLGEYWYQWSIYIDSESDAPVSWGDFITIGQFKMWLEHEKLTRHLLTNENIDEFNETCPELSFSFDWRKSGIEIGRTGVIDCIGSSHVIIPKKEAQGNWHNFLLNINWTDQDDGKIKLWLNEKLIYEHNGKTITKIVKNKNNRLMGPAFKFGTYSQGENGNQIVFYRNFKTYKNCENFKIYNCSNLINQTAKKLMESKSDPDNGTLNVGTYETNEDPEKRKRIIKTLINKITKNIMKKSNSSKNDIENWVKEEIEKLNWDKDLDKGSDRKKLRDKLTKTGIKKFK